jgi:iron complex transport system substrate-binding protein
MPMNMRKNFILLFLLAFAWISCPVLPAGAAKVIVDAAGRRVEVPQPAKRVVTTFKPATLFVLCLASPDALVGVDTPARRDPLIQAVAPELTELPG